MDRRFAPLVAVIATALVVGGIVFELDGNGERDVVTLPPVAAASSSPDPDSDAEPESEPTATRAAGATPEPAGARSPAAGPDSPVSSESEQPAPASAAPARPERTPAPARTRTPAPAPAPSPSRSPATAPRSAVAFDAAYGTDEPREVVVQYGDSSSCPHQNVTHTVKETAERVVVTLEADAMDPGRACTADYRQMLVSVQLKEPMGDRVLVDGSRGEAVPVDRSCERPFGNPPPPKDCKP